MNRFEIVLFEPEIPQNTGNIGRTCVVTGSGLHLIEPLGFRLDDKQIKRAGMDYWSKLDVTRYMDYEEFFLKHSDKTVYYATTKGDRLYTDVTYRPGDFIMFGKESGGIPEYIRAKHPHHCIRVPMGKDLRSLNLSNSVAIVLYEALRQNNFLQLQ